MACEDYPCCGHAPGDCPRIDRKGRERWTCVECGRTLPLTAVSSICNRCMRKMRRYMDEGYLDHDHSMDY